MTRFLAALCGLFLVNIATAHPGHGPESLQSTPLHWLEPVHLVWGIAAVALATFAIRRSRQK